jgi:phenylalanyl-tRNA synthetase beta chain
MKVSLAWMFEYINGDWTQIDIKNLVDSFNKTTAEVDEFSKLELDLNLFTLATVTKISSDHIIVYSKEDDAEYTCSPRSDLLQRDLCLLKKGKKGYSWATMADLGSGKDIILPALSCDEQLIDGGWKKKIDVQDYILDIDNKSITNRPDMWCHRGVAREIAALLKLSLKPMESFIIPKAVRHYKELTCYATTDNPFTVSIKDESVVKRYCSLYCELPEPRASFLTMACRLARVDCRVINAIVDGTNYVMLDMGQPLHAFDAHKVKTHTVEPRLARKKESLSLLDGQTVQLTPDDYVITDGKSPIALAGIMGGSSTAVDRDTKSIFLESAVFDGGTVRKTAARLHLRTDSSARFEKSLDPEQSSIALCRLLKVWQDEGLFVKESEFIACFGKEYLQREITVTHDCIEKRLGTNIDPECVLETLRRLEFVVTKKTDGDLVLYSVVPPSFRATKDITIKEDVIEEIGRYYGYGNIPSTLPYREMKPFDVSDMMRTRAIKDCMAYSMAMREVANYAMFDESFLRELQWQPQAAVTIRNPVSENWCRMVTTLIPGLLKNVVANKSENDVLRFFEYGRVWHSLNNVTERKVLAGIFYNQKGILDFYQAKADLTRLFAMLKLDVTWNKIDTPEYPWLAPYQTAEIRHAGIKIGYAGKAHCTVLKKLVHGDVFMFELDADFLLKYKPEVKRFVPLAKYPGVERDVSIMVPATCTVESIMSLLKKVSDKIVSVYLVDFFVKDDWFDKRSLTFRCILQDPEKTMTSEEVDAIWSDLTQALTAIGAQIR